MGDAGSLLVVFVLAWFVVDLSQGEQCAVAPAQALWIMLIPLMDTVRLFIWRSALGGSPFSADQHHPL
jgi:UDP-GlcNAc:undecaprenyl-phosphate GlcNAc-1-phosphate transferase